MAQNINLASEIITPRVAMALLPAFTSAYALAEEAAETFDFLGGSLKRQILPHLKNWAVEYERETGLLCRYSIGGSVLRGCTLS